MRTLLAHSVLPLVALLLAAALPADAAGVPASIGKLSDYGAVFDRHGKDEVNASIAQIAALLRVDVYVLVSWENPYSDVAKLAEAVFAAWNLGPKRSLLVVFLRTGLDWTASVVASAAVRSELGAIEQRLEQRMADLVQHRRIEEAVRALFDELKSLPAAQRAGAAQAKARPTGGAQGPPVGVLVGAVIGGVLVLAVLIRWRICPRCAGVLRAERSRGGSTRGRNRVYSCRRCGYRRGG